MTTELYNLLKARNQKICISIFISAPKLVDHIVLILLTRPDHAAGEQRLVDAVRELLSLQAEPTMLPEHIYVFQITQVISKKDLKGVDVTNGKMFFKLKLNAIMLSHL